MINFREAKKEDLSHIAQMLSEDVLGARENYSSEIPEEYTDAFKNIQKQKGNTLIIAEDDNEFIGCLQLVFVQGIARNGIRIMQIELIMVKTEYRNKGIGGQLINYAIEQARKENCGMIQLQTDKVRKDAHRFYENLGFVSSHYGMKFYL